MPRSHRRSTKRNLRSRRRNSRRSNNHSRRQSGGRVVLPSEYFGNDSGRYFAPGSPQLVPSGSAYGPIFATSHGTLLDNGSRMGPDLSPFPGGRDQTGGRRRRRN
jgi:hypothetical protein